MRFQLAALLFGVPLVVLAAPSVGTPTATPTSVTTGQATQVTVACLVTRQTGDRALIANGVNLLRLNASGQAIATLGVMLDNGQNGDAASGDGVFTYRFTANEAQAPIPSAPIRVTGSALATTTDSQGRSRLDGLQATHTVVEIDGFTTIPRGTVAFVAEDIDLLLGHDPYVGQVNVIPRPIYLPRLGPSRGSVVPAQLSRIVNSELGVELFVQPNSARAATGALCSGPMYIPQVAAARTPAALPENLNPGLMIAIQPAGFAFSPPAAPLDLNS